MPSPLVPMSCSGVDSIRKFLEGRGQYGKGICLGLCDRNHRGCIVSAFAGFQPLCDRSRGSDLGNNLFNPQDHALSDYLLVFGLTLSAKVAFGVIHGIFPVIISTMAALRNVAPIHRRTARILGLSLGCDHHDDFGPGRVPEIFSGVRIGVAVTLLGTLLAELFASSSGVGFALIRAMEIHNVVDIFALALLIFCLPQQSTDCSSSSSEKCRHA